MAMHYNSKDFFSVLQKGGFITQIQRAIFDMQIKQRVVQNGENILWIKHMF